MSGWFTIPAARDAEPAWPVWARYTRMSPPLYEVESTDSVAAYTPEEQALNTAVHEAAHAVLYMSGGYKIGGIVLHAPGDMSHLGRAQVDYLEASGPWQDFVLACAAGERAEDRWLRESGLWSADRAWVTECHAWRDRSQVAEVLQTCHNRALTFCGDHGDWGDYAWVMDRTDEALDRVWDQVLALTRYLVEHRTATGEEAARIAGFAR
ncbi:hypothetical protein [Streptomyces mirabilis]|uniref:hypothetical protein n=1 Tax=Streptomyces mirabilis TaxID=68239 RepID=UPI0036B1C9C2